MGRHPPVPGRAHTPAGRGSGGSGVNGLEGLFRFRISPLRYFKTQVADHSVTGTAQTRQHGDEVAMTEVICKPADASRQRYSSAVRSFPPVVIIARSICISD